ncbi:EpsG family protein [Chryseobacterium wangxinyae]|uniref:EpsG family protein n=1 Tax=Chryseobacterium sp. CY350 TaxID=2997336 RepID=UPI00226FC116|nr:EpsG family protein [Chryseobacterium sp. CY350]MCY0977111.1 EpsG family protein [Chryseobacterium sp. CY350]WBZ97108.1 EpsG family protein [Chryseobacterium sp. CY350]
MIVESIFLMYTVLLLFICFPTDIKNAKNVIFWFLLVVFILIAGLRPENSDKDSDIYYNAWHYAFYGAIIEVSFVFIRDILRYTLELPIRSILIVYALLGISIKFFAIKRISDLFLLSLLVYFSHYYILHDLTQIRAGVAVAFFLFSIPYIYERNLVKFLLCIGCAIIFHYSAFFLLFIYFVNPKKEEKIYGYLIPLGYLIYFLGFNVIIEIPIPYFQEKLKLYQAGVESGNKQDSTINVFNYAMIIKIVFFYIMYFFRNKFLNENKYALLFIKINAVSIFAFAALAVIPAISYRIHELFNVAEIALIPLGIYIFKNKFAGYTFVIVYTLIYLLLNILYNELIVNTTFI